MNLSETTLVLAKAQAYDNRTVGAANVAAWQEVLADIGLDEALAAVTDHFKNSTDYLQAAHIIRFHESGRYDGKRLLEIAGPPDYPSDLTLQAERQFRLAYQAAVRRGLPADQANAAADRELGYRRPELVARPASIPPVVGGVL